MNDTAKKMDDDKANDPDSLEDGDSNDQANSRNKYTWVFRIKAVKRVVDDGHSVADVAGELGVHPGTLRRWKRNWEKEFGKKKNIDGSSHKAVDSVIARAIEHWHDDPDEVRIGPIESTANSLATNIDPVPVQSTEIKSSPRHESAGIHHDADVYKHQLNIQHFSNEKVASTIPSSQMVPGQASLREILGVLQESRWFILRVILLMLLLAFIHLWIVQPIYRADALLEVEERARGNGTVVDSSKDLVDDAAIVSKEVEVLKSRTVLSEVVDNLKLDLIASPKYFPIIGAAIAKKNPVVINEQEKSTDNSPIYTWIIERIPSITNQLQFVLTTVQTLKKEFYQWLESTDYVWGNEHINVEEFVIPDSALGVTFSLVAGENGNYQLFSPEGDELGKGKVGETAVIHLSEGELVLLVSELSATPGKYFELMRKPRVAAIDQLQQSLIVREKAGIVNSGLLGVTLEGTDKIEIAAIVNGIMDTYIRQNVERKAADAEKTLSFMEEQLAVLEEGMSIAEQELNSYRQQEGSVDLATESEVVLKRIVEVEADISLLTRNRQELIQKFKPKHPNIIALDSQIGTLRNELNKLNGKVKKLPNTQQQVLSMTRDVDVQSKLYSFLYNKIQELKVITAGSVGYLRVVDYASIPLEPVKPQGKVLIVAYLLLGLILGIGASFFRRAINAGIHDPEIIEKQLGLMVHATIPMSPLQKKLVRHGLLSKFSKRGILANVDPDDPAIEGLRGLRTSLYFSQFESRNNLIAITGPAPEVGKSFVSINYAAVLVSAGKRVLVIDADFRRGTINDYVGVDHHEGLSDLITGKLTAEKVIRNTDIEGLDIIPTGKMPSNPSELLLHQNFGVQLHKLSSLYDYVIIDTPPVLAFSDAAVIGRLSGSALLVIKSGMHPLRQLEHTVKKLHQAGVKLEGVVFNGLDTTNSAYGYGQNYGYSYSYYHKN